MSCEIKEMKTANKLI